MRTKKAVIPRGWQDSSTQSFESQIATPAKENLSIFTVISLAQ